jgi:transcription initiation factor TFIIIB Brf1 subunit/transcription initiation factor TFIIB
LNLKVGLVCTKCGQIYKDRDQFQNDPTQEYTQNCRDFTPKLYLPNNPRINVCGNRLPIAKKLGMRTVEDLSLKFNLNTDMKNEALSKYQLTSSHMSFNCTSKQTKMILASVCVYITLMNEKSPVAIGHICNAVGCNTSEFGKVYTQVIKDFPQFKPQSIPIENLISVTLSEANFSKQELNKLEERVAQIISLEKECWLIEGRSPVHIIFAATFLAWKSLKPYERSKVKLTEFCKRVNIEYKHTTCERVTELFNALKTLASKIPGKKNLNITKTNIAVYITEILEYQNSLIYDLNQHMKFRSGKDDQNPKNKSIDWMNAFKRKSNQINGTNGTIVDHVTKDFDYRTKSDEEISDTEIEDYLRDKSEVKMIKKLKKLVQNEEQTNKSNLNN